MLSTRESHSVAVLVWSEWCMRLSAAVLCTSAQVCKGDYWLVIIPHTTQLTLALVVLTQHLNGCEYVFTLIKPGAEPDSAI